MATKVGEFFINLAVDSASGTLSVNQLVGAIGELSVTSVAGVTGVAKITQALVGMANAATNTAVELSVLKDVTGAEPKIVQQWEKAAQRINVQAGSIVRAVQGVNEMMGEISAGKSSPPREMTGWLGIVPQKGHDSQGRPVMKSFFDMIKEVADPKSRYWTYQPQVQQQLLEGAFKGADAKDLFRIINEMRSGRFRPDMIDGLSGKQVKDLTDVRRKETEISQKILDIFEKFLTAGGAVANLLDAIATKLEVLDKWLASKQGQSNINALGNAASDVIKRGGNPATLGWDYGHFLGKRFFGGDVPKGEVVRSLKVDDLHGRLDINITGQGGTLGRKQVFLEQKVNNAAVEQVTINTGNGGLGQ